MYFLGMNIRRAGVPLVFLLMWIVQSNLGLELNANCLSPLGVSGKCILFRKCQLLVDIYNNPVPTLVDTEFLRQSRCGMHERKTLMCCTEFNTPSNEPISPPKPPNCGIHLADHLLGGPPLIDEYPWIALIEYEKPNGSYGYHCGGTLINEWYIVTAAHCIIAIPRGWKVHRVRLGEWDLESRDDCQDGFCSEAPIDLEIEKMITHSHYDTKDQSQTNDIALIRFTRAVDYSETVRPICLPLSNALRKSDHVGHIVFAAGWGITESGSASEKKWKMILKVQNTQECFAEYQLRGVFLKPTQICARRVYQKVTCSAVSGGPLMRVIAGVWYLIGVVSFGPLRCGTADPPGVFMNVTEYVDWIKDNIN